MIKPKSVDEYISWFPPEVAGKLEILRQTIAKAAPEAKETISYSMPAFEFHGVLCYFAAFKDHLSFFPTSSGVEAFKDELRDYKTSKGTIQLPLDKPLPLELITRIVKFRFEENTKKLKK
ncbi:MAG: DUF1801 domain-containing protein [Caldisericia bacterium]|nr:DUF1801 domain-containing protein [Caldisericia bacterium]